MKKWEPWIDPVDLFETRFKSWAVDSIVSLSTQEFDTPGGWSASGPAIWNVSERTWDKARQLIVDCWIWWDADFD